MEVWRISVDRRPEGQLGPKKFYWCPVAPGCSQFLPQPPTLEWNEVDAMERVSAVNAPQFRPKNPCNRPLLQLEERVGKVVERHRQVSVRG